MATILGQRNTSNIEQTTRRLDLGSRIALLEPESTPLTALLNRIGSQKAVSPKFQNFEDVLPARTDTINNGAGYASGATSIVVANGGRFNVEDIVLVPRIGELIRVTAVATNTLTVTRGAGGSTAAALVDTDQLYIIGSAALEGDVSKQARSETPSVVTNYTQIFRDPIDMSGTLLSSDVVTNEHDWNYARRKKGIEHATRIERAFWWGKPQETGTPAVRLTGGFFHFQGSTNATDAGGAFTETELWTAARSAFRYGSRRKLMFTSGLATQVMNQFAQSKVQTRQGDTTYGLAITDYVTPFGQLSVVYHPLFDDTTIYSGYAAVVDLEALKKRFLAGGIGGSRDTHIETDIQENDRDGRKDEVFSDVGLQIGQPQRHGYVYGITS